MHRLTSLCCSGVCSLMSANWQQWRLWLCVMFQVLGQPILRQWMVEMACVHSIHACKSLFFAFLLVTICGGGPTESGPILHLMAHLWRTKRSWLGSFCTDTSEWVRSRNCAMTETASFSWHVEHWLELWRWSFLFMIYAESGAVTSTWPTLC